MAEGAAGRGTLLLVVGPSGAGKDSLIGWCRARLASDASVVFPRRAITRLADGTEDHDSLTEAAFEAAVGRGEFALHWRAHGLGYGIPAAIDADLAAGRNVVANVSRAVLDEARRRYPPVRIIVVTAPAEVLAERLRRRNREETEDIARRLARAAAYAPDGADVATIDNGGSLEDAGAVMLAMVRPGPG
ncbi:MAG: phosphonate metabolism protein/1,5-bisphosphokinase (PRPP-forming) PhnN [Rhizobiales bacterium]|nr:phosphonate metabolism protein/1,5-bisphosphokinase (PRPP-forming) PhnN [Hyphomicrobiales bacterium]